MFWEYSKITYLAMAQIFLLAAIGYFLVKKNTLNVLGLSALSRLVVEVTLPILIFSNLTKNFSFRHYGGWWAFPLLSLAITLAGWLLGSLFTGFFKDSQRKGQFLALTTFQNSGYLPLALIAAMLPKEKAEVMFVYLFLFLLGFNLLVWSVGVYLLTASHARRFELGSVFSPPVIATLFSLVFIYFGLNKFLPKVILNPLRIVGDCTLPLAMLVVGGNLASLEHKKPDKRIVFYIICLKLIILPLAGLVFLMKLQLPELIGLLIMMQLAMPPATSLSLIIRHFKKEDLLISQGVFFGHLASLITVPVFLSLYFMLSVLK